MKLGLHGASAAVHDHVAGVAGDFDDVCAQLRGATTAEVTTHVTRANARSLAELAQWLGRHSVEQWRLVWPGPQADGLALPRLGMVAPRMLHAAAVGRQVGLIVETVGLPPCVLGPHAEHRRPTEARAFAEVCKACSARASCQGVPAAYLEHFERDLELRAL